MILLHDIRPAHERVVPRIAAMIEAAAYRPLHHLIVQPVISMDAAISRLGDVHAVHTQPVPMFSDVFSNLSDMQVMQVGEAISAGAFDAAGSPADETRAIDDRLDGNSMLSGEGIEVGVGYGFQIRLERVSTLGTLLRAEGRRLGSVEKSLVELASHATLGCVELICRHTSMMVQCLIRDLLTDDTGRNMKITMPGRVVLLDVTDADVRQSLRHFGEGYRAVQNPARKQK